MSGQAMSNSLNYADLKRKAVSARSFRINQQTRSGSSFRAGENFSIQLPTAARQYADLGNCYLSFRIYHETGSANLGALDCNAYSIFDRCVFSDTVVTLPTFPPKRMIPNFAFLVVWAFIWRPIEIMLYHRCGVKGVLWMPILVRPVSVQEWVVILL